MGLPIFTENDDIEASSLKNAVWQLNIRLRNLEKQLYNVLTSLDSSNFAELDLDDITLKSGNGSQINGDMIKLQGGNESLEVGYDKKTGQFVFDLPFGITLVPSSDGVALNIDKINVDNITAKTLDVAYGKGSLKVGYNESKQEFEFVLVDKNGKEKMDY